jgi:IPT/TIG domain
VAVAIGGSGGAFAGGKVGVGGSPGSGGGSGAGGSPRPDAGFMIPGLLDAGMMSGSLGIDEAQRSGVAGFPIGIFGTGFGATQGTSKVTILGSNVAITSWSDTVIQAKVPAAGPGVGQIVVDVGGTIVTWPFTLYTIDPRFLVAPQRMQNLILKQKVVITGSYTDFSTNGVHAPDFVAYNSGDGAADFTTPATIAMPLGQAISEPVWFSFMGSSSWYANADVQGKKPPRDYTLEGSANSTNGTDGTWTQVLSVTGNQRWGRSHRITLTGQKWVRLNLLASDTPTTRVMEVRVHRVKPGSTGTGVDYWGVMGDSITADDLNHAGDLNFWGRAMNARSEGTELIPLVMAMSGSKTSPLTAAGNSASPSTSLATAMTLEPDVRYWGIALGINDYGFLDSGTGATNRANLKEGIETLVAAGKVPVLVRIADTIDSEVNPPTTPTMKKAILENEDELAAQYGLIPGPDFYTTFRMHHEYINADGIHHHPGNFAEATLWAEAIANSGIH